MIGNRLAQPRPELDPGKDPVAGRQSVLLDVGRLGLEHQARDVDRRRALGPAELAVNAEIGMRLEFIAAPEPRIDLAGGDLADQVGLRPGRGRLAPQGAEARAHPRRRVERPASAAALAGGCRLDHRQARPAQGGLDAARPRATRSTGALARARMTSGWVPPAFDGFLGSGPRRCHDESERRGSGRAGGCGPWLQVPEHQVRIVADDLARD